MLGRLSNTMSVSGNEKEIRKLLKELAAPYGEITTDTMGNLYVHKPGKGKRIMACAHMDEVGMIVKGIMEDGLLAYTAIGIDSRVCVSKRVVVGPDKVPGVIGAKAIHLQRREDLDKSIPHGELFVDIGAESREDALKYVSVGDYISFDTEFSYFGDGRMKGKALDDRLGCAVVLELLRENYDCDFCRLRIRGRQDGASRCNALRKARTEGRICRCYGRRQDDHHKPAQPILRYRGRKDPL